MKIAVICTGDELLKGAVVNTNLHFIGSQLLSHGMMPRLSLEVRDSMEEIRSALELAFSKADTVIVSGGLGPTADDMTREAAADYFCVPLVQDDKTHLSLLKHLRKRRDAGKEIPSRFLNQCMIPDGADVLPNRCGTASGVLLEKSGKILFLLPGPPRELEPMFAEQVIPELLKRNHHRLYSALFYLAGIPESVAEERMLSLSDPDLSVAYCASPESVKLFLLSSDMELLQRKCSAVRKEFSGELLSEAHSTLAEEIVSLLCRFGKTLATAESCTGGLIAERITDVAGASSVFLGSVVSYSNELKQKILGVPPDILEQKGAVSRETCDAMLTGISSETGADISLAVTGIAGPGGGTPEKPVGLVYTGIRINGRNYVTENHFSGNRQQVRERTYAAVMNDLRKHLSENPESFNH